jgi:hypothetical protein
MAAEPEKTLRENLKKSKEARPSIAALPGTSYYM